MAGLEAGGEAHILEDFAKKVFRLAQDEAEEHWSIEFDDSTIKAPVMKLGPVNARDVKVDRDKLRAAFQISNWGQHNFQSQPNLLYQHLQSQGIEAIAETVESGVKASGVSADELKKNIIDPLQKVFEELLDGVSQITMAMQAPIQTLRRQIDLLWWKEAAFSETLQKCYRSVPHPLMAVTFAIDFANLVPAWCPQPVERFLAAAFWTGSGSDSPEAEAQRSLIDDYLESFKTHKETSTVLSHLPVQLDNSQGRSTLISFASDLANGNAELTDLAQRTGLQPSMEVHEAEICLRIFREIQALRLLSDKQNGASK